MSVNKVILIGRLGKDPELRRTASQLAVTTLSLATSESRKDQSGEWVEKTEWHNVVVFGRNAENCQRFIGKGSQVYVEGRLQTRKWTDKEGRDRYTTEVVANSVKFLGKKGEGQGGGYSPQGAGSSAISGLATADSLAQSPAIEQVSFDDDDIPF